MTRRPRDRRRRRLAGHLRAAARARTASSSATSYVAHTCSYPRPGWAEQDPREWVVGARRDGAGARSRATIRGRARSRRSSFGSQLDGLVRRRRGRRAAAAGDDLDGSPGRRGVRVAARAHRRGAAARDLRLQPRRRATSRRRSRGCAATSPRPFARRDGRSCSRARTWRCRASGVLAVDPSNASSTMLLDVRERALVGRGVRGVRRRPDAPAADRARRTSVLGPVAAVAARGDRAHGDARWSSSAAATRWRRRSARASSSRATSATSSARPSRSAPSPTCRCTTRRASSSCIRTPTPRAGCSRTPGWLSGGAYRWFRDHLGNGEVERASRTGEDVYELLNVVAAEAPPGADGLVWLPALAGAMTPEWNARRARHAGSG